MSGSEGNLRTPFAVRLLPGEVFDGRYEITRMLGQGANGTAYEARVAPSAIAPDEGRTRVALKVIHPHLGTDSQTRSRFFREMKILARLEGESLVALLGWGETPAGLYMVLELAPGESLEALLLRGGPLPLERGVWIVLAVCDALASAHAREVIHRDLKPGNIMVASDPEGADVRVLDFGMAKILGHDGAAATVLTERNIVFGTPEYMSPEQARGDELDVRSDVYSAGVILYELVTGAPPFRGLSAIGLMTAHLNEAPIPPRARSPSRGISGALEHVILHALAKRPDRRYPSATAFRDAIRVALAAPDDVEGVSPAHFGAPDPAPDSHPPFENTPQLAPDVSALRPTPPPPVFSGKTGLLVGLIAGGLGVAVGLWLALR